MSETKMDQQRKLIELERQEADAKDNLAEVLREARDAGLHKALNFDESIVVRHIVEIGTHRQAIKSLLQGLIKPCPPDKEISDEIRDLAGKVFEAIEAYEAAHQKVKEFSQNAA